MHLLRAALTGAANCFVSVPAALQKSLSAQSLLPPFVLQLTWSGGKRAFVACAGTLSAESDVLEVPTRLAAALGLASGETIEVSAVADAPLAEQVNVEPPSADDWEVLSLQPDYVEQNLLSQLGVVYEGLTFPVVVLGGAVAHLRVGSASPAGARCWRLTLNTEVVVAPNERKREAAPAAKARRGGRRACVVRTAVLRLLEDGSPRPDEDEGPPTAFLSAEDCEELGLQDGSVAGVTALDCAGRPVLETLERLRALPPAPASPLHGAEEEDEEDEPPAPPERPKEYAYVRVRVATAAAPSPEHVYPGHVALSPLLRRQLAAAPFSRIRVLAGASARAATARATRVTVKRLLLRGVQDEGEAPPAADIEEVFKEWVAGHAGGRPLVLADGTWVRLRFEYDVKDESGRLVRSDVVRRAFALRFGGLPDGGPSTPPELAGCVAPTMYAVQLQTGPGKRLAVTVRDEFAGAEREAEPGPGAPGWAGEREARVRPGDVAGARGPWEAASGFLLAASALRYCDPALAPDRFPQFPGAFHLHGPHGCGKSWIARGLASWLAQPAGRARPDLPPVYTTVISCRELARLGVLEKSPGAVRRLLRRAWADAAARRPAALVLDDVDEIAPADPKDPALAHDPYGTQGRSRSLAAFLARLAFPPAGVSPAPWQEIEGMEGAVRAGDGIALLLTSRGRDAVHPILRDLRIVRHEAAVPPPDAAARADVLRALLRAVYPELDAKGLDFGAVAHRTEGYAPEDLRRLAGRAAQAAAYRARLRGGRPRLTAEDLAEQQARGFRPLSLEGVTLHKSERAWAEIGGLNGVREEMLSMMQLPARHPDVFAQCPIRLPTGLLLYGPPGCGKTLLGHAAATECGLNFITVKGPELLNKYIGASEAAVRDVFARARAAAPSLLFFDEFDALAPKRGHDSTGVTDRVVNQLLTELDGVDALRGVYVLAASSRPDLIDAALLRPGRLDRCLRLAVPSRPERVEILRAQAAAGGFALAPDADVEAAAARTAGYSGADLRALLQSAHVSAVRELLREKGAGRPLITRALLEAALASSKPSVSEADRRRLDRIYAEFEADRSGGGAPPDGPSEPPAAAAAPAPDRASPAGGGKGRKGKAKSNGAASKGNGAANGGPHGSDGEEAAPSPPPPPAHQRVLVQRATLM